MENTNAKQRLFRSGRIAFHLGETMAAVSQMALLCPHGMDAWMKRELAGSDRSRSGAGRRR